MTILIKFNRVVNGETIEDEMYYNLDIREAVIDYLEDSGIECDDFEIDDVYEVE